MKIYISGPITGVPDYMERFAAAEKELTELGHEVINPARVNAQLPESTTWEQYMAMCYTMLDMADAIYMLTGWEKSRGAIVEQGRALMRGISVFEECEFVRQGPGKGK